MMIFLINDYYLKMTLEYLKNELEKQKSNYEKQLEEQKLDVDKALQEMKDEFQKAEEVMSEEHAATLARMEVG